MKTETTLPDPLATTSAPDRPNYAFGVMLDARDFTDEQTYHRARLARALQAVHGAGTIAGLAVAAAAPTAATDLQPAHDEELQVAPGYAVDGLGRLVEIGTRHCISLARWWQALSSDALTGAFRADTGAVVADLFVRFVACGRGRTPAFAYGPADALDATVYARVRDGFELRLALRAEPVLPVAADPWAAIGGATPADRLASVRAAVLGRYDQLVRRDDRALVPPTLDPSLDWLLLARVSFAAARAAGAAPVRTAAAPTIDNNVRSFVIGTGALARLLLS
jgi:hypothetical protein